MVTQTASIPTAEFIQELHQIQMDEISKLNNKIQSLQNSDPDRLVTRKELAEDILGVSESTVDNMRRKGIIEAYYLGAGTKRGKPKFKVSEVLEKLAK
jgi:flagellar hook assembly protein FlgD